MPVSCPQPGALLAFVEQRRSDNGAVERHLDVCALCREVVAQLVRGFTEPPLTTTTDDQVSPSASLRMGSMLGRYRLDGLLGTGGMGKVYLAYDTLLLRPLALKVQQGVDVSGVVEAQLMAAVTHPHVLRIFDVSVVHESVVLALELVDGPSLSEFLTRRHHQRERVRVLGEVASGLDALHKKGIVHRDVKPDNILVFADGRAVVADLGLAHSDGGPRHNGGTRGYLAPEVEAGAPADAHADQFAFGVCLLETLASDVVPRQQLRSLVRTDRDAALAQVPRPFRAIAARCLAPVPSARYASMAAVQAALLAPQQRRRRLLRAGAGAVSMLVIALLVFAVWQLPAVQCRVLSRQRSNAMLEAATQFASRLLPSQATKLNERVATIVAVIAGQHQAACIAAADGGKMEEAHFSCLDEHMSTVTAVFGASAETSGDDAALVAEDVLESLSHCGAPPDLVAPTPQERAALAEVAVLRAHRPADAVKRARVLLQQPLTPRARAQVTLELAKAEGTLGDESSTAAGGHSDGDNKSGYAAVVDAADMAQDWYALALARVAQATQEPGDSDFIAAALQAVRRAGDSPNLVAKLRVQQAASAVAEARMAEAKAFAQDAVHLLDAAGALADPLTLFGANHQLCQVQLHFGELAPARASLLRALAAIDRMVLSASSVVAMHAAVVSLQVGLATRTDDRVLLFDAMGRLRWLLTEPGIQADAALRTSFQAVLAACHLHLAEPGHAFVAIEAAKQGADTTLLSPGYLALVELEALHALGRTKDAHRVLRETLAEPSLNGSADFHGAVAELAWRMGLPEVASKQLQQYAQALAAQAPVNPVYAARAQLAQAQMHQPHDAVAARRGFLDALHTLGDANVRLRDRIRGQLVLLDARSPQHDDRTQLRR